MLILSRYHLHCHYSEVKCHWKYCLLLCWLVSYFNFHREHCTDTKDNWMFCCRNDITSYTPSWCHVYAAGQKLYSRRVCGVCFKLSYSIRKMQQCYPVNLTTRTRADISVMSDRSCNKRTLHTEGWNWAEERKQSQVVTTLRTLWKRRAKITWSQRKQASSNMFWRFTKPKPWRLKIQTCTTKRNEIHKIKPYDD